MLEITGLLHYRSLSVTDCAVIAVALLEASEGSTSIPALVVALQGLAHLICFLFLLSFTCRGPVIKFSETVRITCLCCQWYEFSGQDSE